MQTGLLHKAKTFLLDHHINLMHKRVLMAVSGGMDSVIMVELFRQLDLKFGIAHCNFQLRGEESDADEALVKALADKYKVPFYTVKFDTAAYMETKKVSVQVAARELRYDWFEKVRAEQKYDYIATAHHLNDNLETVLHNFIKGTGIKGLRGMQVRQNKLIRPLLALSRKEIQAFQQENNLEYREDSSNASDKYTRNKIRHHLLPLIEEINPGFEAGFAARLKTFADLELLYQTNIQKVNKQLFEKRKGDTYIPIRKLRKLTNRRSVLFEFIQPYGFNTAQVDDILACLDSDSGKQFLSPHARIIKDRQFLILTKNGSTDFTTILINKEDLKVSLPNAILELNTLEPNAGIKKEKQFAYLDIAKMEFPLTLRHWKKGDYFYPFGMALKKKKISKYFKDQKIPIHEKDMIWILESNKKIAWVVGERIDERFRVSSHAKQILRLQYKQAD